MTLATGPIPAFARLWARFRDALSEATHVLFVMPKVHHALFSTSLGEADRYRVVDCATGRTVWDVPSPTHKCP